jgi:hypothetical protein
MVTIWDRRGLLRGQRSELPERVELEVGHPGEALAAAEGIFSVSIRPASAHDRYFLVESSAASREQARSGAARPRGLMEGVLARLFRSRRPAEPPRELGNTDIHVLRGGAELCPKQDLAFPLQDGDVVVFEVLLC